jgi:hypothetical protein
MESVTDNLLDTLVKLAAIGTSGVCLFFVFWCGHLVKNLPDNASAGRISVVKHYMTVCVAMAVITGLSGGANAYFNRHAVVVAETKVADTRKELATVREDLTTVSKAVDALKTVPSPSTQEARVKFNEVSEALRRLQHSTDAAGAKLEVRTAPKP